MSLEKPHDIFGEHMMSSLESLSIKSSPLERTQLNTAVDYFGHDFREFGLSECKSSAEKIFTTDVINNWSELSKEERTKISEAYAESVARNFELVDYKGLVIEKMDGMNGFNRGDGVLHLSDRLINTNASPLQVVDTITHELRHQYQVECIKGFHYVPEETRVEWAAGLKAYTTEKPWALDPWGYKYNPLEIDSRYAGETVVRELTKDLVNGRYYA